MLSLAFPWSKLRKKALDDNKWWRSTLNSEPQPYVITSETLQVFALLYDIWKIPDVRTLLSLKKGLNWK